MLEVRDLVKVYPGAVAALRGLSLTVPRGMFGLLGPNGAGKSTLMRIVTGLLAPSSGTVRFGAIDVIARPEALWPRLGYLPQDFGFYPQLTGKEMLHYLLSLKGVGTPGQRPALCDALLDRVNLTGVAHRKVRTYSGGMRQRLGVAQAIAGDPALVVVDEPTAGLDPEERLRFHALLAELAHTRAVLLSTHIVEDVATLCPRFAVIAGGRLLADTTPGQARTSLEGRIFEGTPAPDDVDTLTRRGLLIRHHLVEGRSFARVRVDQGPPPAGFTPATPTLEDAYLLLTRTGSTSEPGPAPSTARG